MPIPDHPSIRTLGFVEHDVREALLSRARALMMPSPFESLSMVLLEAWNHGLPALVNARCKVLRGQVERADGGLYYGNAVEFSAALDYLLDHPDAAAELGRQGLAYVDREYRWPTVMEKIERLLRGVDRGASPRDAARRAALNFTRGRAPCRMSRFERRRADAGDRVAARAVAASVLHALRHATSPASGASRR